MSKSISGLFRGTLGERAFLEKNFQTLYFSDGSKGVDVARLPGSMGMKTPGRLSPDQMMLLTDKYGVEFALVYYLGRGRNGRGGQYYLYSGTKNSVEIPIQSNTILIYHTHPGGTPYPSRNDMKVMSLLAMVGSPQKTSAIVPSGKGVVKFTKKGLK